MHRYLKAAQTCTTRVTKSAGIYLAAVAEYLVGMCIRDYLYNNKKHEYYSQPNYLN
jgi:hypothetical protein